MGKLTFCRIEMSLNNFVVNDITCATTGAVIEVGATDGAMPLTYHYHNIIF